MPAAADRPHVVAVVGSPRRNGNTIALVDAALAELERRGCRTTRILLGEVRIDACEGHVDCGELPACPLDDDTPGILDLVYAGDALLLASPVYYENVSSQMKAFMDRNVFRYSRDEWLPARVVGLIAVALSTGLEDTLAAMRRFVALSRPEDAGEVPTFEVGGYASEPGDAAADADLLAAARGLGAAMADELGLGPA